MNDFTIVIDPLGNLVHLTADLYDLKGDELNIASFYEDASRVIKKPALILKMEEKPTKLYYFKPIAWEFSLLLGVIMEEEILVAIECHKNPSDKFMHELIAKGQQLL